MSSMDRNVVATFFAALDAASRGVASEFRVDVTNPKGMNTLRVIACDEETFCLLTRNRENLLKSMDQ